MPIINRIAEFQADMTAWRRDLHAHPELGYEETRTAATVAEKLRAFGCDEVVTGIAATGVVGVIRGRMAGDGAIGLRADMDALPIQESTGHAWASTVPGKMHACGHDGHTTMLLGAARYLAETRNFQGTAVVIFQPAEEGGGGGQKMLEEGLLERFPLQTVWGMHNWPGHEVGTFAARTGPMMAAVDTFDITITGEGGHAAMAYLARDPIVVVGQLIQAVQTIVSRNVKAVDAVVVSITRVHSGDAFNVVPETASVWGTVRTYLPETRELVRRRLNEILTGLEAAFGVRIECNYALGYPTTVNSEAETEFALEVARELAGAEHVRDDIEPSMGAEDFAYMLQERPGCYIRIGNGPMTGGRTLHSPHFDFNDAILPWGASYWARLVERALPAG